MNTMKFGVKQIKEGFRMRNTYITVLAYVDDVVLLTEKLTAKTLEQI